MEEPWRYRSTAAIALGWEAGFRPRARRGILEIHDCLISHPLIGALAHQMNLVLRGSSGASAPIPNYHGKVWLDCTVVGKRDRPALQVVIQGIQGLTVETHPELPDVAKLIAALDGVATVAYRHRAGHVEPLIGDLMSTVEVAGREMLLPAGSFSQTNLPAAERVLARMEAALDGNVPARAADVYGGIGTFGLPLATVVSEMTIVELDRLAVDAARRTARLWGLKNVRFMAQHAEQALSESMQLDLVIVDPPRSGLGPIARNAIATAGIPLVMYVSCYPPSLAQDLAALQVAGYRVRQLELFDFYPHTYHVECLAIAELPGC
jgi:23S rRNA (uracil1939-C5)-methyltransferase